MERQHGSQGFVVLWISVDEDLEALRRAVAQRQITGLHIAEGKSTVGTVPWLYRIPGSYFTYLIGRDGKIAAKDIHDDALARAIVAAVRQGTASAVPEDRFKPQGF